jgi:DNA replication regulator DPB11
MWSTLLKSRGYELCAGKLVRSPSKSQPRQIGTEKRNGSASGSVIDMVRRERGFVPKPKEGSTQRQPFRRIHTSGNILGKGGNGQDSSAKAAPETSPSRTSTLFPGIKFRAIGEARCANVKSAVEGCGGRVVGDEEADEDVDYIVVRLVRCGFIMFIHILFKS